MDDIRRIKSFIKTWLLFWSYISNKGPKYFVSEMVSTGDTEISLHI